MLTGASSCKAGVLQLLFGDARSHCERGPERDWEEPQPSAQDPGSLLMRFPLTSWDSVCGIVPAQEPGFGFTWMGSGHCVGVTAATGNSKGVRATRWPKSRDRREDIAFADISTGPIGRCVSGKGRKDPGN